MNPSKLRVNWFLCAWHPADNTVEIRSQLDAPSASWFRFFFFPPSSILKSKCYMKALNTRLSRFKSYTHFPRYYHVSWRFSFASLSLRHSCFHYRSFHSFFSFPVLFFYTVLERTLRKHTKKTYRLIPLSRLARNHSHRFYSHIFFFFSFFLVNNHKTVVRQEIIVAIFGETWQT